MEDVMKRLDYQPSSLSNYELEHPLEVVTVFFDNHALHDIREKVWQLYKGWVVYSSDFTEGKEATDMLFFYSQLIDFLNASYVYANKKKVDV
ncbi:hypothetical protein HDE69_002029 [Pedobacter cryoconitis]|uniref:Uncharacterized protein n=1 Tax=Pedobacter cryoconitis TaxID=188932 RepID=A0A7W9DJA2_9SPHI|nr:hypothetical protein [Pedobacter cryoconitis]MBB5620976.1 hypothetical protein [Pedobacter cryoconitis]